jgi:hypothetical protein
MEFYRDRFYMKQLYRLAAPIAFQNLLTASLTMAVVLWSVSWQCAHNCNGVGRPDFFRLSLILFDIGSDSVMFTAKVWGNKDIPKCHLFRVPGHDTGAPDRQPSCQRRFAARATLLEMVYSPPRLNCWIGCLRREVRASTSVAKRTGPGSDSDSSSFSTQRPDSQLFF